MATTSLWHIEGRLKDLIDYVENPEKTKAKAPELIHKFVDKIMVYAPKTIDGKRVQILDIYYSGVCILHELTPEEMEEAFQQHLNKATKKNYEIEIQEPP